MKLIVGGEHLARRQAGFAAAKIGDEAARLAHQDDAGGDVPELEILLPETIEPASRQPGEVECGRAEAANACHFRRNRVEDMVETTEVAMRLVGNAGGDQRVG